ncbi:lipocalin family protein [Yoonia sediminilitoris]|uniref:Outer membrane lipoprotein Blc n=1 Tax=Yoonia sediminilitoris TaxID=1286148 RepID=A0A2T6KB36_9RHOB|nr:lipocalin family protein [Yoonia sediminilitoris]PUB12085.1 apolipoprotein D and lipocalin family protein [Yoonia sediminilitoris]RCW92912.1 apolipoprotein D and lipocalin family protein [Yoonia sediminilitoris]
MKALVFLIALAGCATQDSGGLFSVYRDTAAPIASKAVFDPARYLGTWHEVARYPVPFEAGCVGVTATYGLRDDGLLSVLNICRNADGSEKSRISGTAEIVGAGRLKVQFASVPFVRADYWVLWTDDAYRTAVVGAPNGRSGWILNRTPDIRADRLQTARDILEFNGYDLSRLMEVSQ